ncbi:hypothetical protein [Hamadaea tsunoensis]|uniref:hypothetical protein n=1 Tax=Hamadaea tsunoensis TaxID=53368 RepID=UPI000410F5DC|nr:hypothetical protein [Hamadaea tsunoensis]
MEWGLASGVWNLWAPGVWEPPPAAPTELEIDIIEAVAATLAQTQVCGECAARLSRHVRIVPCASSAAATGTWCLLLATGCLGWRHHGNIAVVTPGPADLEFGPFRSR